MIANRLRRLTALGQSIWLDDIRRRWLVDGTIGRLIAEDGLSGLTSNPSIFERSITRDTDYDEAIEAGRRSGLGGTALYEALVVDDIRMAADILRDAYEGGGKRTGFVSLEVSPHIARDATASIAEGQRLWALVGRPNLMVKIPGTTECLPAIQALVAQGVNVNVTLLFSVAQYRRVADAYLQGVEDALFRRQRPGASVASFFVSRIDTLVDARLDDLGTPEAHELRGYAAIACARLAYTEFKDICKLPRFNALATAGARSQRLLWASTSVKDRGYPDVKYLEALAGPNTVTTVPVETLNAYRDHGDPASRLELDLDAARQVVERLRGLGVEPDAIGEELQVDGLRQFARSYDQLLAALDVRRPRGGIRRA